MIRQALGYLLLAALLAAPVAAAEKAKPKLSNEAKDGVQTTQENITKMKLKKAQPPTFTPPPPAPATPPSVN